MQSRSPDPAERRQYVVEVSGPRQVVTVAAGTWGEALRLALEHLDRVEVLPRVVCNVLATGQVHGHDPVTGERYAIYGEVTAAPPPAPTPAPPEPRPERSEPDGLTAWPLGFGAALGLIAVVVVVGLTRLATPDSPPWALREAAAIAGLDVDSFSRGAAAERANRDVD